MFISSVTSAPAAAARPVQKSDGVADEMNAQASQPAAKPANHDADTVAITGIPKVSPLTSPVLQTMITFLTSRG